MIKQLINFIEAFSVDNEMYFAFHTNAGPIDVRWKRDQKTKWFVSLHKQNQYVGFTTDQLIEHLEALGADMKQVERAIGVNVLTQAVFADMLLEEATKIFGPKVVQASIEDTKTFLTTLKKTADEATRLKLRVIQGAKQ